MKEYIAFDSHKRYTLAEREDRGTGRCRQCRIDHEPGAIRKYLKACEPGTPVALEATGNWYWIVEEIEAAGLVAQLVHPRKAKLMMGMINKTDKLDVHGLNRLQRNGTLPTVWVPPGELRDQRELTRGRMVLSRHRTRLKNRIHATLSKYGRLVKGVSDLYGKKGRQWLSEQLAHLPEHTRGMTELLLNQLDLTDKQIAEVEKRLDAVLRATPEMELLRSLPGIGPILAAVLMLELGDMGRFAIAERYASYAGTTPRVHGSGGKFRYGKLRPDVNRYLKWAYVEAGNSVALNCKQFPERHVSQRYRRIKQHQGHSRAIGAVARHLAEATFHVLTRKEPYREPALHRGRAMQGLSASAS